VNHAAVFSSLLPFLLPIAIGYCLARWLNLSSPSLLSLVSYIFLPVVLYHTLAARLSVSTFLFTAGSGAAVALVGILIAKNGHRVLKVTVDPSAGFPCVVCFTLPFLALCFGSRGLGTACGFFIGVALTYTLIRVKKTGPLGLLEEPWIYAAIIGLIFAASKYSPPELVTTTLSPLLDASYAIMLLYLGSVLHPFGGWKDPGAWATVAVRLVSGFVVALLAIAVLPVSAAVATGLMLAALAPPGAVGASRALEFSSSSRSALQLGSIVSLILMVIVLYGWRPWAPAMFSANSAVPALDGRADTGRKRTTKRTTKPTTKPTTVRQQHSGQSETARPADR
jgi:predicted permease